MRTKRLPLRQVKSSPLNIALAFIGWLLLLFSSGVYLSEFILPHIPGYEFSVPPVPVILLSAVLTYVLLRLGKSPRQFGEFVLVALGVQIVTGIVMFIVIGITGVSLTTGSLVVMATEGVYIFGSYTAAFYIVYRWSM